MNRKALYSLTSLSPAKPCLPPPPPPPPSPQPPPPCPPLSEAAHTDQDWLHLRENSYPLLVLPNISCKTPKGLSDVFSEFRSSLAKTINSREWMLVNLIGHDLNLRSWFFFYFIFFLETQLGSFKERLIKLPLLLRHMSFHFLVSRRWKTVLFLCLQHDATTNIQITWLTRLASRLETACRAV